MSQLNQQQENLLRLYEYMVASRESDIIESELVNSGEANFLASSKGHEGGVIFEPFLKSCDYLHCHYRDKALMLARGISPEMFFYSALAKAESHSYGRQMVSHMSAQEFNITSIVGAVGSNALQAAGVTHRIKDYKENPIVLCGIGDGTTQQGEIFEAIAEAKRSSLPILFVVHNNNYAISTETTGKTFFSLPNGVKPTSFYDIPISHFNGADMLRYYDDIGKIISNMRSDKQPHIVILNVDRLDNHSNADDQKLYRSEKEIEFGKANNDPLILGYQFLKEIGIDEATIADRKVNTIKKVRKAIDIARSGQQPHSFFEAEVELEEELKPTAPEYRGNPNAVDRYTMLEAMRETFNYHLANNKDVYLLGEDIEDKKGDVFGVTKGLSTKYPKQVKNSPLSESTIVGMSIGMALAGAKPVAFIQFADFIAPAFNQIYTELATMYWRTNGSWQCPVIIFAACGGYRPGLGPFHSQTNEGTYAHIPGIDVFMPSNAADAVGMLNAAFKSNRPSLFLYPKKLLNNASDYDTTSLDIEKHLVPIGKARIEKSGTDITLVGWGNTISICREVDDTLEAFGISCEIIDLRTIKPYDKDTIIKSTSKTKKLVVVHEDNITCGVGGDIMATVLEKCPQQIQAIRVTRPDTYTPCNFKNQLEVLPSYEKVLAAACKLLNIDLAWQQQDNYDQSIYNVEVIGASPSDESVLINTIFVKPGDIVNTGDKLVDIEASKSAGEILSPCAGTIEEIMVNKSERAVVGNVLLKIKLPNGQYSSFQNKQSAKPILTNKVITKDHYENNNVSIHKIGINTPVFKTGSRVVTNQEILLNFPNYTHDDIVQRTGISQRYWLNKDEDIISIANDVAIEALEKANLKLGDISAIICATCTPDKYYSPSVACLILDKLYKTYGKHSIFAYDINAACSGYIFALQNATEYLKTRPDERVLLVTAEHLSKHINQKDFDTAFLFGDAATATIVSGENYLSGASAIVKQIYLTSIAEDGEILNIPTTKQQGISLQGKKLFSFAVKSMSMATHKCCQYEGISLSDLDLVVPHQANQRIIDAIEKHLNMKPGSMYSNINNYGNTSSCTIPIALAETLDNTTKDSKILLTSFGGGFTIGSALLTKI